MTKIYYATFVANNIELLLAATEDGVCFIDRKVDVIDQLEKWLKKRFKMMDFIEDEQKLAEPIKQLKEYLNGERSNFTIKMDYCGTQFQEEVWQALININYGEIVTYSEIAQKINRPKAVRAVGTAIGANPLLIVIPCHRVVGKDGSLTGFRSGLDLKVKLLEREGVHF